MDREGAGHVSGHILWFDPTYKTEAWDAVAAFEPGSQYRFDTTDVDLGTRLIAANVLVGRQLNRGTADEEVNHWSVAFDPVFVEGLAEVYAMTIAAAPDGVAVQPDHIGFWRQFFQLQAAYLLLWAAVERYTALRFGPDLEPGQRIGLLGRDTDFTDAVVRAGAPRGVVYDSRRPSHRDEVRPDGTGAVQYFYRVRSNLSHRGKSAFRDGQLVYRALVELHDSFRILLAQQVPELAQAWGGYHMADEWLLRSRVPTDAFDDGERPAAVHRVVPFRSSSTSAPRLPPRRTASREIGDRATSAPRRPPPPSHRKASLVGEILSKKEVGRTRSGSCRWVASTARDQASGPQPTVTVPAGPRAAGSS